MSKKELIEYTEKIMGKEKGDNFLAKFGIGPAYVPVKPKKEDSRDDFTNES